MIVNLTPHEINFRAGGRSLYLPSSGTARIQMKKEKIGEIDGIPVNRTIPGKVEGLPEEQEGVVYIVSRVVVEAMPDRKDLFFPDELIRDEKGRVIGCSALGRP